MKFVREFPREVIEYPDMAIMMRDGTRLSARVWMPKDAEDDPVPIILEHLPYRKRDGTIARDQFSHPWMAGQGYCCIRTDMRGSGESEGLLVDEYTQQELDDAWDVIAWAVKQPWCNGNAGMQGISWGGFNSLQLAAMQPPGLKAIITVCSSADRYNDDIHYKGGCLLLENFGWSNTMLSYSSRPPDPALVGENWLEIWKERLENQPWLWDVWHSHQTRDEYWNHGSVCEDYSAIKAAVLTVGGWHDGYRNTISDLVENLSAPVRGIVGPWNHKYPHYAGPKPAIGFLQESKRWWDHWLKGEDTGVENDPDYRVYLMDSIKPKMWFDERPGKWITFPQWPATNLAKSVFYLGPSELCEKEIDCERTVSSPQHCGMSAGEFFPFAFSDELPADQSADDALSVCFDGEPSTNAMDIIGAPEIQLEFSADKPSAFLAVRLCDLRPDGTSALITHGVFNLTHHVSHEFPEPLTPGKKYKVCVLLDQIAYALPTGHKLRIAISNSYWPTLWPSAETASVTIHKGQVALPMRKSTDDNAEWRFEEPIGSLPWRTEELRPSSYTREIETDAQTGTVTLAIDSDNGEMRDMEHGLISGSWYKERFSIHPDDPNSATANAEWEQTGGRDGAMWRTHVETTMTCDKGFYKSTAILKTFLNGQPFFEKEFSDKVPRAL